MNLFSKYNPSKLIGKYFSKNKIGTMKYRDSCNKLHKKKVYIEDNYIYDYVEEKYVNAETYANRHAIGMFDVKSGTNELVSFIVGMESIIFNGTKKDVDINIYF